MGWLKGLQVWEILGAVEVVAPEAAGLVVAATRVAEVEDLAEAGQVVAEAGQAVVVALEEVPVVAVVAAAVAAVAAVVAVAAGGSA